jgi:hypothetical protein
VRSAAATGACRNPFANSSAYLRASTQLSKNQHYNITQKIRPFFASRFWVCPRWPGTHCSTCKDNTDPKHLSADPEGHLQQQGLEVAQRFAKRTAAPLSRHTGWCTLEFVSSSSYFLASFRRSGHFRSASGLQRTSAQWFNEAPIQGGVYRNVPSNYLPVCHIPSSTACSDIQYYVRTRPFLFKR